MKYLMFLLIAWMLLSGISKLAEVQPRQLEPLPSLETRPDYGPALEFVYC